MNEDASPIALDNPTQSLEQPELRVADEKPRRTLAELLTEFTALERSLDDADFDPATIVGNLQDDLALKVDAIRRVVAEYDAFAERTKARVDNLTRRIKTATSRARSLEAYVLDTMQRERFERLNGNEFYFAVVKTNPAVECARPPTSQDFLKYGKALIRYEPESFAWDKVALARSLKGGGKYDFATLKPGVRLLIEERDRPDVGGSTKGKKK